MSTRIVIDLPAAASDEEEIEQLLRASQSIALVFRDMPKVKVQVQPAPNG
jgi:hypothetical protein